MKESTMNLLCESQRNYLLNILKNRELIKAKGKKYVTVERDFFEENEYKVYLVNDLERSSFDLEIVEYIEL